MRIKICGMRDADNIRAVEQLNPDMIGFICWDGSPRNVLSRPSYLPNCTKVGVFVNPTIEHVVNMVEMLSLNALQLHGSESPETCRYLKEMTSLPIIKAFSISTEQDLEHTTEYEGIANLFVFDTKCKEFGGSGKQFDWSILDRYNGNTPFLLSGGIGMEDIEKIKRWRHPKWIGIDLNSRFEIAHALKDVNKLKEFISNIRPQ